MKSLRIHSIRKSTRPNVENNPRIRRIRPIVMCPVKAGHSLKLRGNRDEKKFESALGKVVFGIVLSLLGIFMILYSRTFPKVRSGGDVMTGPSFFPTIIGILMIAFGIYTIILNLLSRKNLSEELKNNDNSFFKSREFFNFLIFVLFIAIYPTVINVLGFFIGTFLFCFILMRRLQAKWPPGSAPR